VDLVPEPRLLPVAKTPPAGHPAAAARLPGQTLPGMPVRSTYTMPVRAALSGTHGRPPLGLGGSGGRSGLISCHNSSDNPGFAILL